MNGCVENHVFDLRNCTFTLNLTSKAATASDAPTEIFLPEFHFPEGDTVVAVSGGKWEISFEDIQSVKLQRLRWWHGEGEQNVKIEGAKRQAGEFANLSGEDESYLDQCQRGQCVIM